MADIEADVIRIESTAALLPGLLKNQQLGFENTNDYIIYKDAVNDYHTFWNATKIAAYIAEQITLEDLDFAGDGSTSGSVDLDSQTLTIAGGTNITTVAGSQTLTINLDTNIVMADGAWIGRDTAGPKVTFNDTSDILAITGCKVGIGDTGPTELLKIKTADNTVYADTTFRDTPNGIVLFNTSITNNSYMYLGAVLRDANTASTGIVFVSPTVDQGDIAFITEGAHNNRGIQKKDSMPAKKNRKKRRS